VDKQSATKLLEETFDHGFREGQFSVFVKELLNNFDLSPKQYHIWREYSEYIDSYKALGSYKEGKQVLDVLVVKLKKSGSIERARTMQRNFVAKYLGKADKDAALVAFYYNEGDPDWRFSFVKMEYRLKEGDTGKVKLEKELTPAKRYSFLVDKNELNHTCKRQFLELVMEEDKLPSIEDIESAFSIEKVTKEFFLEYKGLYLDLEESLNKALEKNPRVRKELEEKGVSSVDFAKKLLGQIVFLYFLQKKGWLGVQRHDKGGFQEWGTGPKNFLRKLFAKDIVPYNNFFNDVLEPLFYEALAKQMDDNYSSKFNCKIPFLNGGLFEPIGDYAWTNKDIFLENYIFQKILDTFDRYNFTIKEDEPLEKEVAIDPEMLGKVFENLLEIKDRKSKGSYYTPREIVHYMCQQSLINYLETNLNIPKKDVEDFIQFGEFTNAEDERRLMRIKEINEEIIRIPGHIKELAKELNQLKNELALPSSIIKDKENIDSLLRNVKIVDPAVGSGAFPVGMMTEIVKARSVLTPFFLSEEERKKRTDYALKRETIENCLYGVDIDASAVDITKLRFWLSLIVDEMNTSNIKPLPNLDYKIMCGNSLLEEFEGIKLFDDKLLGEIPKGVSPEVPRLDQKIKELNITMGEVFTGKKKGDIKELKKEIFKLERQKAKLTEGPKDTTRHMTFDEVGEIKIKQSQIKLSKINSLQKQLLDESDNYKKKTLRNEIDKLEWGLIEETLKEQGNEPALRKLAQYKKNKSKPFFLWKLHFAEVFQRNNPGFDIVIANPPYVSAWSMEAEDPTMRAKIKSSLRDYTFLSGHWDLYVAFVARGDSLLRSRGSLSYIMPNPILREKYATDTRKFFLEKMQLQSILEFNDINVFENVARRTSVLTIVKNQNKGYTIKICGNKQTHDGIIILKNTVKMEDWLKNHNHQYLIKGNKEEDDLILNLEKKSERIGNYFYVNYGVQVSSKEKGKFGKKEVVGKDPRGNSKKFYEGKDVHRWHLRYRGLYLDYRKNELYGPRATDLFENEKIVIRKVSDKGHRISATLDSSNRYTDDGNVILIPYPKIADTKLNQNFKDYEIYEANLDMKYVLSILLSKTESFYFRNKFATESLQGSTSATYPASVRGLLIRNITLEQQKPFIRLVDQILSITKDEDYLDNSNKQAKVRKLEEEIDRLVYKLYDITEAEQKIIEESFKKSGD